MKKLFRVAEKNGNQVVSARDLHTFLGSKKAFSTWIKKRINKYGLIEGRDFLPIKEESIGGRPSIEYAFPTDVARGLSMVEGNAKGKQARQYLIACEKLAKSIPAPKTPLELAKEQVLMFEEIERQELLSFEHAFIKKPKK